jgi:beta-lactamase class D
MPKNLTKYFVAAAVIFISACTVNKADIDNDIAPLFKAKNVDGCFTLLDNKTGRIIVHNLALDTTRFLPASTFKIINSLIGLETGAITNDTMVIKWDGKTRNIAEWNQDLTMRKAFEVSAVPYYQEVARRIGAPTLKKYIDSLGYGNKTMGGAVDTFWLNNTLKISPDEQLGLVKKLYFDQLPFRKSTHEAVRQVMLRESNTNYKLSYKTGWGVDAEKKQIGWVVGWIEENNHVYFFTLLLQSPNPNIDYITVRKQLLTDILKHYGFFEGKK